MKNSSEKEQTQNNYCVLPNERMLYKRLAITLILTVCFAFTGEVYCQRLLPGMRGIQVTGGMADGFYNSDNRNKTGYYFGLAIATYGRSTNKWVFGAEFINRYYPYKDCRLPVAQFTAEGGYFFNFLSDRSKTFFCSLGGSALAGYETINRGDKLLFDGSTLENSDHFLYGIAITLEMETYLTDRLVLLLRGRERILPRSDIAKFHTQFGLGLRFMIN